MKIDPRKRPGRPGGTRDTTPAEKTQYSEDTGPMRAIPPTVSDVALELIREYARTERKAQIDGIGEFADRLFEGGLIPEDGYQAIRKVIIQVKESGTCQ